MPSPAIPYPPLLSQPFPLSLSYKNLIKPKKKLVNNISLQQGYKKAGPNWKSHGKNVHFYSELLNPALAQRPNKYTFLRIRQ